MPGKRRKPRGKIGLVNLPGTPVFHEINLPHEKRDLEKAILKAALRTAAIQGEDPYQLLPPRQQNAENDFDFTLTTRTGLASLDLVEVAPLDRYGSCYASIPQILVAGEFASAVYERHRDIKKELGA